MATSEVDLKNQALASIGADTIVLPDEDTRSARVAAIFYDQARDALLREYRWNFAIGRVENAGPSSPQPTASGFQNKFLLPTDFLKFVGLVDGCELPQNYTSSEYPHLIEGRYVLADGDVISYTYIRRITDVSLFDPSFTKVLVHRLGADMAIPLTSNAQMAEFQAKRADKELRKARIANAFETWPERIVNEGPHQAHTQTGVPFSRRFNWARR